jgi:hypothetical protein
MMRLCLIVAFALSACASGERIRGDRIDWRCDRRAAFSIRIDEAQRKAEVFAGGRVYRLDHVGSGYSNETVRYFERNGSATLTGAHGGPYDNCQRR